MEKGSQNRFGADGFNQRGIELADRGWLEEAVKEFNRAIELDHRSPFPRINRASVYLEQGRLLDALSDLIEAVRLAPDEPATHYHLGVFLSRYGSNLAVSELHASLNLDPEQVDALLQLGATYADRGEGGEAEESLRAALEVDGSDPAVNRELGVILMERGKIHDAIRHLRVACEEFPTDMEIQVDLGMAYIQAGFYEKAEATLNRVLSRDPENLHANYNLAAIYTEWAQTDQALSHLGRACAVGPARVRDWLSDDRMFDKLRADPRFAQLIQVGQPGDTG
jgi:tetratricopeptide (TPR) repeat protein